MQLLELAEKYGAVRTGNFECTYLPVYEKIIPHGKKVDILELGAYRGGGLRMWRDWCGVGSRIVGVDMERMKEADDVDVRIADLSTDRGIELVADLGEWDVIIDDASHKCHEQTACFLHLWPKVKPGGWYVIEDVHAAFWGTPWTGDRNGWGLHGLVTHLFSEVNAPAMERDGDISQVTFRPSLIVIRKAL